MNFKRKELFPFSKFQQHNHGASCNGAVTKKLKANFDGLISLCRDSDGNNQHVRHNPGIPGARRGGMADQSRGTANFHQV